MTTHLNEAQVHELRRRLEEERARILEVLRATRPTPPEADQVSEVEEEAQRTTEVTIDLELEQHERPLLAEVDRALGKLERGGYGLSEKPGRPIPFRRLAALPWARDAMGE